MTYVNVKVPAGGAKITIQNGKLNVPDNPIIPFVEGDGTGRDIWRASVRVLDSAPWLLAPVVAMALTVWVVNLAAGE